MLPETYLDVRPALTGGYQVILIAARQQRQAIFDTPADVAALAVLLLLALLTDDADVRAAGRAAGVRLLEREERHR